MPATTAPAGYSSLQIALNWVVFALIAQQYVFKDVMSAAWDLVTEGLESHNVMKILLLALVALHVVAAQYHQFVLRDGTLARMRSAQG